MCNIFEWFHIFIQNWVHTNIKMFVLLLYICFLWGDQSVKTLNILKFELNRECLTFQSVCSTFITTIGYTP
jgi:hypothetical protein